MATFYLKPGAGGTNAGTMANPFLTTQDAMNAITGAGDICYCCGTDTLSSSVTVVTNGSQASPVQFIATNSLWNEVDGTYYTIDANSAATYALAITGKLYQHFKRIIFTNAINNGMFMSGGSNVMTFEHCKFISNGARGCDVGSGACILYKPQFINNTTDGFSCTTANKLILPIAYGNGIKGINLASGVSTVYGGYAWDNIGPNLQMTGGCFIINFTSDDSVDSGMKQTTGEVVVMCSNMTNNGGIGLENTGTGILYSILNGYRGNTGAETSGNIKAFLADISISSQPYANPAGRDYTQDPTATDHVGVEIVVDANNSAFMTTGAPPEYPDVTPSPTITDVSPFSGATDTEITISGDALGDTQGTGSVTVNGVTAVIDSWADDEVVIDAPANIDGTYDIILTNDNGDSVTAPNAFQYGLPVVEMKTYIELEGEVMDLIEFDGEVIDEVEFDGEVIDLIELDGEVK